MFSDWSSRFALAGMFTAGLAVGRSSMGGGWEAGTIAVGVIAIVCAAAAIAIERMEPPPPGGGPAAGSGP